MTSPEFDEITIIHTQGTTPDQWRDSRNHYAAPLNDRFKK